LEKIEQSCAITPPHSLRGNIMSPDAHTFSDAGGNGVGVDELGYVQSVPQQIGRGGRLASAVRAGNDDNERRDWRCAHRSAPCTGSHDESSALPRRLSMVSMGNLIAERWICLKVVLKTVLGKKEVRALPAM
jgi:hypothetical protein